MVKLTNARIAWLVREVTRGRERVSTWADRWGVTTRHLRRLVRRYKVTGEIPTLNPNRRPKGPPLTPEQERLIDEYWGQAPVGATELWERLKRDGISIPKHKIHNYLRKHGRTVPNPRKQKRRSRTRYERDHSGSLIHGDWHRTSEDHPHVILWLDDASRRVLAGGEFANATAEHSITTFDQAVEACSQWGLIVRQVNTDRGAQFYANENHDKRPGLSQFQKHLIELGIQFIPSRPQNPQTNGKLERLWLEYDRHRWRYETLDEWIAWTNDRPHSAHQWATPKEAFQSRLPPETLVGLFVRLEGGQRQLAAEEVKNGTF